jgi:hypothetical protein
MGKYEDELKHLVVTSALFEPGWREPGKLYDKACKLYDLAYIEGKRDEASDRRKKGAGY